MFPKCPCCFLPDESIARSTLEFEADIFRSRLVLVAMLAMGMRGGLLLLRRKFMALELANLIGFATSSLVFRVKFKCRLGLGFLRIV